MTTLTPESYVTASELARVVPAYRPGTKTHVSTIVRWILRGARGPAGDLVKLRAWKLGGRWVTTLADFQTFMEALTPQSQSQPAIPRSPTARARAAAHAEANLAALGW